VGITRNEISNPLDKRAAINEFTNEVIIDSEYGTPLPTNFRAIVLSGFGDQAMLDYKKTVPLPDGTTEEYYFVRVRPLNVQEFTIPSPFIPQPLVESRNLILSHPLAFVKAKDIDNQAPQFGRIYECRFLNDKKQTGIRIIEARGLSGKTLIDVAPGTGGAARRALMAGGAGTITPPPPAPTSTLSPGFLPGSTEVNCFGYMRTCSELINFGRTTPVDLSVYQSNPAPSQVTDDLYWKMVIEKLGATSTPNKIRFFNAWAAREGAASTNNPFATTWPGGHKPWSKDPNMTAFNWSKPTAAHPRGKAWVRNYSTMELGALATALTIKSKERNGDLRYGAIITKIRDPNPDFPDSWFDSSQVKEQFEIWGGRGADGVGYAAAVKERYKKRARKKDPINTNSPGGRSAGCLRT
jgi:hypothetical protein